MLKVKLFGSFSEFSQSGFAAGGSVFLEQAFFGSFVVFRLSFGHGFRGRISLEGFKAGLDVFLNLLVLLGAFLGLASSFFRGFDNRH